MLISEGLITEEQLAEALEKQKQEGGKTVQNLIQLGYLDRDEFTRFLARRPGMPSIDLRSYQVDRDVLAMIPREYAERQEIIPIDQMGNMLSVAMVVPLDTKTIQEIEATTDLRVRAFLCSRDDFSAAFQKYLPLWPGSGPAGAADSETVAPGAQTGPEGQPVDTILGRIEMLPPLPESVRTVQRALRNDDIEMRDIVQTLKRDPAVSAKVVSIANSPAFGVRGPISNLERAIALIGLRDLSSIVLAVSLPGYFDGERGFDFAGFWRHSEFCGNAAAAIARLDGHHAKSAYYTAGLLHNIGVLALAKAVPDAYAGMPGGLHGNRLVEEEAGRIGIAHTEAGYLLGRRWGLPDELLAAIQEHHRPAHETSHPHLIASLQVATFLYDACTADRRTAVNQLREECQEPLAQIDIEEDALNTLVDLLAGLLA